MRLINNSTNNIAEQLLQELLQEIGDPNSVAVVLQMTADLLQNTLQDPPVFKKGGKLHKSLRKW